MVEYRKQFLKKLYVLETTYQLPQLPEDGMEQPYTIGDLQAQWKLVVVFHDESVFHSNDDLAYSWVGNGHMKLKPKGQGQGIMISDFIDEYSDFLRLTDAEMARYQQTDPSLKQSVRKQLVIGHGNEGYWTNE